MELTMDNAVEYTEYMLREYYRLNAEPFLSVLDSDVMWIGPGNLFLFGEAAVKSCFKDGFVMPRIELKDAEFYRLKAGTDACIVAGRFTGCSEQAAKQIIAGNQRITVHYSQPGKNKPVKLTHLHVSNEWSELVDGEVFPVRVSVQTYRYVQKLLAQNGVKKHHKKIELKNESAAQYIDPDMTVYAEAIGKHTLIHFVDKAVTVRKNIGEIAPLFPENFYRPHRGYLINCDFVASTERCRVTMITGTTVPIPEKRYVQVREEISAIMKNL